MTTPLVTLRDMFVPAKGEIPALTAIARAAGGLQWRALYERSFDVLDINVVDVLVAGWKKQSEVRELLQATAADPTRTALVQLAEHTLESTHKPSMEVRSAGKVVARLTFTIEAAFELDAVELVLRHGRVEEVRPGRVTASGTVKLENSVILERKAAPLTLPGKIVIADESAVPETRVRAVA
jgi:hypothetical protein